MFAGLYNQSLLLTAYFGVNHSGITDFGRLCCLSGVLSMVLDLYSNARVPDVLICPISFSYDRIPEESLYAYELLGIPKPKESLRVSTVC